MTMIACFLGRTLFTSHEGPCKNYVTSMGRRGGGSGKMLQDVMGGGGHHGFWNTINFKEYTFEIDISCLIYST